MVFGISIIILFSAHSRIQIMSMVTVLSPGKLKSSITNESFKKNQSKSCKSASLGGFLSAAAVGLPLLSETRRLSPLPSECHRLRPTSTVPDLRPWPPSDTAVTARRVAADDRHKHLGPCSPLLVHPSSLMGQRLVSPIRHRAYGVRLEERADLEALKAALGLGFENPIEEKKRCSSQERMPTSAPSGDMKHPSTIYPRSKRVGLESLHHKHNHKDLSCPLRQYEKHSVDWGG
ncbi:hypothetical protein ACS0TY_026444 [Phlomoides rotata]